MDVSTEVTTSMSRREQPEQRVAEFLWALGIILRTVRLHLGAKGADDSEVQALKPPRG